MKWTEEQEKYLVNLKEKGLSWQEVADRMTERFGGRFRAEQCRSKWRMARSGTKQEVDPKEKHGYEFEKLKDGSHNVKQLIEISEEKLKDEKYVLNAHGYDPAKWELTRHRFSKWLHHNKQDGTKTLYSSQITVKPKENEFDWDEFLETIQKIPQAVKKPKHIPNEKRYLLIPLFDMHFGISDYEHYIPTQSKILRLIRKGHKETLLLIGSDLFHHNDHRNRTASGREIQHADMIQAWEDATKFYEPILSECIEHSGKVSVVFVKGNHDESLSWAFTKYLEARFPQVECDTSFKERKARMLGLNFVGANHGDKKREKDLAENFATEFPLEWSKARNRDVFVGHRHSEMVLDKGGIVIRRLPTRNKTDDWHEDMGFTTAHKRFQLFEYSERELESIHYV